VLHIGEKIKRIQERVRNFPHPLQVFNFSSSPDTPVPFAHTEAVYLALERGMFQPLFFVLMLPSGR
jgi:hypothetical protein